MPPLLRPRVEGEELAGLAVSEEWTVAGREASAEGAGGRGDEPVGGVIRGEAGQGCAVDTFIEQDKELGKRVPVSQTPTYVFTNRGQRLAPGAGRVAWPLLKQFFDSLN